MLRKSLIRNRVGGIWCASARATGVDFQACSIDHSDISPFRINHLRAVWNGVAENPPSNPSVQRFGLDSVTCERADIESRANCVRPSNVARSLTEISAAQPPRIIGKTGAGLLRPAWRNLRGHSHPRDVDGSIALSEVTTEARSCIAVRLETNKALGQMVVGVATGRLAYVCVVGSVMMNVAPAFSTAWTSIRPPIARTQSSTIDSPRPIPPM